MQDISFTIPAVPVVLPLASVIVATLLVRARRRKQSRRTTVIQVALSLYAVAVLAVTLFPLQVLLGTYAPENTLLGSVQWMPILTIDAKTFLLNIVMFAPFGVLVPLATKWTSARSVALAALLSSLGIETIQLITQVVFHSGRAADVNDLIANTAGAVIGYTALTIAYRSRALQSHLPPEPAPLVRAP